jgi:uncharacterized delta-60 repeat protein
MYLKTIFNISLLFVVLSATNAQNAGTLDESFGNNGIVVTSFNQLETASSIAVDNEGRIVLGGYLIESNIIDVVLARYLDDGSLDPSFSDDGLLRLNYPGSDDYLNDLAIQDDGKIVFVGETSDDDTRDIIVVRLNQDGSFDNTFSNDGIAIIDVNDDDFGRAVAIQDDGKIVVAGTCVSNEEYDLILCRLNSDGTFDNTFAGNGKLIYDVNWGSYDFMNDVALYGGNIFVSGYCWEGSSNRDFDGVAVLKFDNTGQPVASFGDNGLAFFELEVFNNMMTFGSKMAINANGIYIATQHEPDNASVDMAVINFLHNGYPNDDFGNQGIVIVEMVVNSAAYGITLQPDGKILTCGGMFSDYTETNNSFGPIDYSFVARFLTNGELDADFGAYYGVSMVDVSPNKIDEFQDICLQDDHKIVACGYAFVVDFNDKDFSAARLYSGLEVGMPEISRNDFAEIKIKNPVTEHSLEISFYLSEASEFEAHLYNMRGEDLGVIFKGSYDIGVYHRTFNLTHDLPQGIYVLQIMINGQKKNYRLIVV